jgi:ABC-type multidrug transport system permease subunit
MRHPSKGENFFGMLVGLFWLGMSSFVLGILTGGEWFWWWVTGIAAVVFVLVAFIAMISLLL